MFWGSPRPGDLSGFDPNNGVIMLDDVIKYVTISDVIEDVRVGGV